MLGEQLKSDGDGDEDELVVMSKYVRTGTNVFFG